MHYLFTPIFLCMVYINFSIIICKLIHGLTYNAKECQVKKSLKDAHPLWWKYDKQAEDGSKDKRP
jgi:hypothetical protein